MLLKHRIVLDVIGIADGAANKTLLAISKITHGQCFAPGTIAEALELCELETLLSLGQRPATDMEAWKKPGPLVAMQQLIDSILYEHDADDLLTFHRETLPERRQPEEIKAPSMTLSMAALVRAPTATATAGVQRRLMFEISKLLKDPHPNFDIYPTGRAIFVCLWAECAH
jgi:hypothetical protein